MFLESELRAEFISVTALGVGGECRRIYTVLSSDETVPIATHLVEDGPFVNQDSLESFVGMVVRTCEKVTACVLAGSLPRGAASDFYGRVIREVRARSECLIVVDARGGALREAAKAGPDIVKINCEEFNDWAKPTSTTVEDVRSAMASLCDSHRIKTLIVTRADESALAYCSSGRFVEAIPPSVRVVNPAGGGDSFCAGLVLQLADGLDAALRMAVAAGSASVIGLVPGAIQRETVEGLRKQVILKSEG
jgi:fructose-1-phosphate kinase PfkB-like protein